jgi:hypothetical protein
LCIAWGPDNIVSLTAATIYGSTETTFYVAAVYFGAVGIKQTRHAIPVGLPADLTGVIASRSNLPGGAVMVGTDRRAVRQRVDPANPNGAPGDRALPNRQSIIVQIFPSPADNLIFYRAISRK